MQKQQPCFYFYYLQGHEAFDNLFLIMKSVGGYIYTFYAIAAQLQWQRDIE